MHEKEKLPVSKGMLRLKFMPFIASQRKQTMEQLNQF
jgi:hypothetical protein